MPGINWIPGISQIKAGLQLLTGDVEGASQTNEDFFRECPGVSQLTSVVQVLAGDSEGALETQKRCLGTVSNVADGIPVIGHVKGVVHHIAGDHDGGNRAINAATRSSVVIGSGVAAGLTTGGLAGIPAGVAAGAAYDSVHTMVSDKPQGLIAGIDNAITNPSAGSIFDVAMIPVGDCVSGYAGGKMGSAIGKNIKLSSLETARNVKQAQIDGAIFGETDMTSGQMHALGQEVNSLTSKIDSLSGKPGFAVDAKGNTVVVSKPTTSGTSSSVVQSITSSEKPDLRSTSGQQTSQAQKGYSKVTHSQSKAQVLNESSRVDSFGEENGFADNPYFDQCKVTSQNEEENKIQIEQVGKEKQQGPIRNHQLLNIFKQNHPRQNKNQKPQKRKELTKEESTHWDIEPVRLPSRFTYTSVSMLNNPFDGLLHALIGHGNEFSTNQELPFGIRGIDSAQLQRLLDQIKQTSDMQSGVNDNEQLREQLVKIQIQFARLLEKLMKKCQYLSVGHDAVNNTHILYFDLGGDVLALVFTNEKWDPRKSDPRPIRFLITAFRMKRKDYNKIIKKVSHDPPQ